MLIVIRHQLMSGWLFTLRERFTREHANRWHAYLKFSGFTHIDELVTLDSMMCPDVITDLRDEDWNHNVHEDFRTDLFWDPDYLMKRQPLDAKRHQLLAVLELPNGTEDPPSGFTDCGFDIMDSYFGNSTLTNCGPIPDAFDPSDVNRSGLLPNVETAYVVRDAMRRLQPDDPHLGDCEVWRVARRLPDG
jgi:hypothetical protein